MSKICTKCKIEKPRENFSKKTASKDGLSGSCKECRSIYDRKRKTTEEGRIYNNKKVSEWYKTDKGKLRSLERRQQDDKIKVRSYLNHAVRDGKLVSESCEICGDLNTEAHHWSYAKEDWLHVNWLCERHHRQRHKWLKELGIIL